MIWCDFKLRRFPERFAI